MANPYMRDALLEQMNPDVQAEPQNKLGWNRPANKTPPQTPDGPGGSFDPGWGIETQRPPTSSAYSPTSTSPTSQANPGYATTSPGYEVSTVQPSSSTSPSGTGVNGMDSPYPWDKKAIDAQYQTSLGRSADEKDYLSHVGNPGGQQGVLDTIKNSDEAKKYASTPPVTPPVTPPPITPPVANAGQNRYAGFDTQRAQDPSKSAKDAFYAATQQAPPMPKDKAGSEVWFNQYIKSALESAGYKVDWVKGDKAFVRTRENPQGEEIDFNQGADSDASSVAWQSNMAGQTTAGTGTGAPGSAGANTAQLNGALTDPAVLANINAQITALMKQGMTMEQIMTLLNTPPQSTGA